MWTPPRAHEPAVLKGHTAAVQSVAFSPDSKRLASASIDRTAKVWDMSASLETLTLADSNGMVWCIAFSPDSRLASVSEDKTVKL